MPELSSAQEYERALSALNALDPGVERDEWVRLGMAAMAAGLSFEDWHEWSSSAGNYKSEADCRAVWRSLKDGGIGAGTLFAAARSAGWADQITRSDQGPRHHPKVQALPPHAAPTKDPSAVWNSCVSAPPDHPYLVRKGMAPDGLRVAPVGVRIAGESCAGWLALPIWNVETRMLQGVQFVSPAAGSPKLSLPGCRISGGALIVHPDATDGRPDDAAFSAGVAYLCEGVATAATVFQSTGRAAVTCFGKGNLGTVARSLRSRFPALRVILCPDRGAEPQAEEIVRAIGMPAAWVALPSELPPNYDLNDYAGTEGLEVVRDLLAEVKTLPQRFRFSSASDLASRPLPRWVVRGVLPKSGIGAIYGPSTSGKTFLALHLLAHIANGDAEWFGHRIGQPAGVIYVGLEGEGGISGRVKAWLNSNGALPGRMQFMTGQALRILSDQDVTDLACAVRSAAGAGAVVCIDTLNAAAPGADENSSEDMGRIIDAAKRLQAAVDGVVILIHHSGKDTAKGMRGHSSLFAALDFAIEVQREPVRQWKVAKSKDGADDVAHPFRLDIVEIGEDPEDGEPVTSCVVEPDQGNLAEVQRVRAPTSGNMRKAYDVICEALKGSSTYGQAGAPPTRPCVRWESAVELVAPALPVDPKRRRERAQAAVTNVIGKGYFEYGDGWIWLR
jgi:putative DNA primase/helicase